MRTNITALIKPMLDAFHYRNYNMGFSMANLAHMYGGDYADKFAQLAVALDYKQSALDYLRSEDFTIEQLKAAAGKVSYYLTTYEWDDDSLTEAFENATNRHGVEQFDVNEMTVYNTSRTYLKWQDNDKTLYSSLKQMVEDSNDDVLSAFKAAGEEPLDHLDPHTVRKYIDEQVDKLIEHLEDEAVDDPGIWQKLAGTPVRVEANAWYLVGEHDPFPKGATSLGGLTILPVKE